ncbi:Coenzyme F420 hydrogenase/dehydrogenase, beta subunit C-terminal domain [Desulfoluna butyratoxydans]|nr:Coenzyme F420 hydrogenase/dehydrogenase, beta subunit C-terminal domain [Desulfoluna butyratoxydans]
MNSGHNIRWVVDNGLCLGCGVCEDACPMNAIHIVETKAINVPHIDSAKCAHDKGCNHCFKVCPGHGIDIENKSQKYFGAGGVMVDPYIGPYVGCYTGWSQDHGVRYHAASGGLLSQFLIFLLESNVIDGAVVTRFSESNPMRTQTFIAKTREEIIDSMSSKYCPVSLNGVVNEVMSFHGKVIIVGLPCHIQGMRKTEELNEKFRANVAGYFSIYCSSNRNFDAQKYLCKKQNIKPGDVKKFTYRDNGCLGFMKILTDKKVISVPFIEYYESLRSYFKPRRCSFCVDHYGMLADVSFGDIHIDPYFNEIGVNSVVVRSPAFHDYLVQAQRAESILLNAVKSTEVNRSQQMMLKNQKISAPFYFKFERFLGRKVPIYDLKLSEVRWLKGARYWLSYTFQRWIGRWIK